MNSFRSLRYDVVRVAHTEIRTVAWYAELNFSHGPNKDGKRKIVRLGGCLLFCNDIIAHFIALSSTSVPIQVLVYVRSTVTLRHGTFRAVFHTMYLYTSQVIVYALEAGGASTIDCDRFASPSFMTIIIIITI